MTGNEEVFVRLLSLQVLEAGDGGSRAGGEFEGVDVDPAVGEAGVVEGGEERGPVGGAAADDRGFCSPSGSGDGVASAEVADEGAEGGEEAVEVPGIAEGGDGVKVEAEPGTAGGAEGAVEG